MKAAVLFQTGSVPAYSDVPTPIPENDQQQLITVKAASIKQLDLLKASGNHYTGYASLPAVVGVDGVGVLADGRPVYAMGQTGMMAEQALVATDRWCVLPEGLDYALAAALPNALLGADAALRYRARIEPGATVLINGATGVTGMLAVQLANYHGAKTIIATGRNPASLQSLKELGADEVISLNQPDDALIAQFQETFSRTPVDLVQDYLWGHPMELMLAALAKNPPAVRTRMVTVGEMAGASIALPSGILRSRNVELIGSGIGSLSGPEIDHYLRHDMPPMLALAAAGKLTIPIRVMPLQAVEEAWQQAAASSQRIVLSMPTA